MRVEFHGRNLYMNSIDRWDTHVNKKMWKFWNVFILDYHDIIPMMSVSPFSHGIENCFGILFKIYMYMKTRKLSHAHVNS